MILEITSIDIYPPGATGDSAIKVSGGTTPRVLSRAVQLIKLVLRAAKWSNC